MKATKKAVFIVAVLLGVFCVISLALAEDEDPDRDWHRTGRGRMMGAWSGEGRAQHPMGRMSGGMQGQRYGGSRRGRFQGARQAIRQRLELTDEQVEKLKEIRLSHKEEFLAVAEKLADAHRVLRDAVKAGDEEKIRATAAQIGTSIAERAILTSKVRKESRAVLTPEQLNKLDAFQEARETMQEARHKVRRMLRQRLGEGTEKD
jgi:Spy/CpxP family protein refolding chaperone